MSNAIEAHGDRRDPMSSEHMLCAALRRSDRPKRTNDRNILLSKKKWETNCPTNHPTTCNLVGTGEVLDFDVAWPVGTTDEVVAPRSYTT